MARQIASPNNLDLETPGRRDYWVSLGHTSVWGSHLIPLTVLVGPQARPGEGLVAFGGTHGNEYEGPVAIKHLIRATRLEDVQGRLVLVPVLNPVAFRANSRESLGEDGYNLNRVFVDGAGTTPALAGITHRIVAFVREAIWPHVHISIDLHSGGEVARFAHWAGFFTSPDPALHAQREQMARWFGTPVVMSGPNSAPGGIARGLYNEADDLGKFAIGTELGYGSSTDLAGVHSARHGVLAAAIHHHQLRGSIEPIGHHAAGTQHLVGGGSSVLAPYPGHYEPLVDCGQPVSRGQTVGLLHDFYRLDEEPFEARAASAGIVVAQAWGAPVEQGRLIVMVADKIG